MSQKQIKQNKTTEWSKICLEYIRKVHEIYCRCKSESWKIGGLEFLIKSAPVRNVRFSSLESYFYIKIIESKWVCFENLPLTFTLYFVWETDVKIAPCYSQRIDYRLPGDGGASRPLCLTWRGRISALRCIGEERGLVQEGQQEEEARGWRRQMALGGF